MSNRIIITIGIIFISLSALANRPAVSSDPSIPLLRLRMVLDSFNYDDIAIGFLTSATTAYNNQIDSRYFPGINAPEGFYSLSSDNVPLSANIVPLPGQAPLVIRLDVEAMNSGQFTMQRTELDSIPQLYDIWLMDKFTGDSLSLRTNTSYVFNINKSDTNSFGGHRFTVVIRQNAAMSAHLLGFSATKTSGGNELTWTTENEQNTTSFWTERSIDGGNTFVPMDSLKSNGSGAYSYTDRNPFDGTNLYRVKMSDINGMISFSNIVSVSDSTARAKQDNNLSIYPNPSTGVINLAINPGSGTDAAQGAGGLQVNSLNAKPNTGAASSSYTIRIVNIKGLVIRSARSSSTTWQDNLGSATPGTYFVEVVDAENKLVGKSTFVKL